MSCSAPGPDRAAASWWYPRYGCASAKASSASRTSCCCATARTPRRQNRYWLGADLVAEVVSPDDPDRDLVEKRTDYAEAGIPEYWIADPRDETLTVLVLRGEAYVEHGRYARGEVAASVLLDGFAAEVSAVFDAPETGG